MDESLLRQLAEDHLVPLFSGTKLEKSARSTAKDQNVAFADPCTIWLKADRSDTYRLALRRKQIFDKIGSGRVTERNVVDAFVRVVKEIEPGLTAPYKADLLSTFQRRVVVKAIAPSTAEKTLLGAIDQLALWATRLYEGKPVTAALGFVPSASGGAPTFEEICQTDFSAVISNGFDTLLAFDIQGSLIGHEAITHPTSAPSFAPYRQGPVAQWAKDGRIALTLNRLGEILVFKDQKLLFARRSGKWHFLTHEPVLMQMGGPQNQDVRRSVYESLLDVSFARTGACVGLVTSAHWMDWRQVVAPDDHLDAKGTPKTKAIARMLDGKPFQNIERRLRQELLAIDGATLLDHDGNVLAVGAILKIPGGSTGGGRLAAAKTLSKFGVGVKVSQDGSILGFRRGNTEPQFYVM